MTVESQSTPQLPRLSSADTRTLLASRRTVHDFLPQAVPDELVQDALDLARWAPNHHRTEPWRFYLLGQQARTRIVSLNFEMVRARQGERAAEVKTKRWQSMPGWLLLTCARSEDPVREREDYGACCCAAQNLMLYLWSEGVGVKWSTGGITREDAFYGALGLAPATEFVVGLFWYGWPATVGEQQRRPLAAVLTHLA